MRKRSTSTSPRPTPFASFWTNSTMDMISVRCAVLSGREERDRATTLSAWRYGQQSLLARKNVPGGCSDSGPS